ncbi:MAG: IS1595 family transposase [Rhodospirillaceae bacterium]|nr:IS1595 family transposase [Rhodospirillaceae bacterium]
MAKTFNIQDFFKRFPTDDSCLEHLMATRYGESLDCPKCDKHGRFARLKKLPAYSCPSCGHHIHPMAGTPFERSRTPLQKWFYAMYLFTTTRNGVSAKELQRQLGVTYKCAWRIGHEIRKYMGFVDGDAPLGGKPIVEVDEAFVGGHKKRGFGGKGKTVVFGMVEREGEIITRVVPGRHEFVLVPHILENVYPGTRIATDELRSYSKLPEEGYLHGTVNHSRKEYVRGPVHTNTIEGFWSWMKRQISGTHVWASKKHLPKYLAEMEYRFNLRKRPELMFELLLQAFPKP